MSAVQRFSPVDVYMQRPMRLNKTSLALLFLILICCPVWSLQAAEPDWSVYGALLKDTVHPSKKNGVLLYVVDYKRLQQDARFNEIVSMLAHYSPSELNGKQEKLAFYINAYNILAMKMVLDHWPLESIRDAGSFFNPVWKKEVGVIGGKTVSLHEIEHLILRKMGEPRIHMAIVCASVSCPDLRAQPYNATDLEQQLESQTRDFLRNPGKGLRFEGNEIVVSKIFDWFEDDFKQFGGVANFIKRYRNDLPANVSVEADLPYDWTLNNG